MVGWLKEYRFISIILTISGVSSSAFKVMRSSSKPPRYLSVYRRACALPACVALPDPNLLVNDSL